MCIRFYFDIIYEFIISVIIFKYDEIFCIIYRGNIYGIKIIMEYFFKFF